MARERDFPASRKPGVESATTWILAMLGVGVIAALIVLAVVPEAPEGQQSTSGATSEQVVPNTPPPVRTE